MYTKTIGYCGVDSGQLFITDPCYIKHQDQGNGQWNMERVLPGRAPPRGVDFIP